MDNTVFIQNAIQDGLEVTFVKYVHHPAGTVEHWTVEGEPIFVKPAYGLTFHTESGSSYTINPRNNLIHRAGSLPLRGDERPLEALYPISDVTIGKAISMMLEPLSEDATVTARLTSYVTGFERVNKCD